jgi:hypothetical protein
MVPEVEKELRHSPIRADRWACGRVLLYLLDKFRKKDKRLRAFARNLGAYNPKEWPSLLELGSNSAGTFSDIGNVRSADSRKATQAPSEDDGESTKPPTAKK